jgi:putative transposase
MGYKHEQHSVHLVLYHIIWCLKRRRKVLVGRVHDRLKQLIGEGAAEQEWEIIRLAIQPDHVHLFIQANAYPLPADIPRLIKGAEFAVSARGVPATAQAPVPVGALIVSQRRRS